jgi:hypothetical protein
LGHSDQKKKNRSHHPAYSGKPHARPLEDNIKSPLPSVTFPQTSTSPATPALLPELTHVVLQPKNPVRTTFGCSPNLVLIS